jgi:hypothetical protein
VLAQMFPSCSHLSGHVARAPPLRDRSGIASSTASLDPGLRGSSATLKRTSCIASRAAQHPDRGGREPRRRPDDRHGDGARDKVQAADGDGCTTEDQPSRGESPLGAACCLHSVALSTSLSVAFSARDKTLAGRGQRGGDNDVLVSATTATPTKSRTSFSASLCTGCRPVIL